MASSLVEDPRDRAFERLYSRYVRDVYRYVLAVLRNPAEAEDVTQTTFLNAYRAMQAGEEPQKPHNWLIAIAHNACRSRVRFTMRRPKEVPIDDLVEQLAVPESERPNIRELLRALGRLPFNQRAAITMRELEGRSYTEIADTLGVTVPAAEALIARARRTLRSQAAALRGLTVIQLPRSLRKLFENPEATGGTVGATAAAKAAAVLVAGVVAGGVGYTAAGDAQTNGGAAPHRLEPRAHAAVSHAPVRQAPARILLATVPARHAAAKRRTVAPPTSGRATGHASLPPEDQPSAATSEATASGSAATPTAAPAAATPAPAPQRPHPAQAARTAVTQTVAAVTKALPAPQPPPVAVPAVTLPAVTVPSVPAVPPPPTVTVPQPPPLP